MKTFETIETMLLACLVALSLAMTGWLMVGVRGAAQDSDQPFQLQVAETAEVDIQQVLGPARIILHLGESEHTVMFPGTPDYRSLWDDGLLVRGVLGEVGGAPKESPVDLKALRAESGCLELVYSARIPFSQMVQVWTGSAWAGGEDFPSDRILVTLGKNPAVLAYSYKHDKYLRFDIATPGPDAERLTAQIKYIAGGNRPRWIEAPAEVNGVAVSRGVLLPQEQAPPPVLEVTGEHVNSDDMLQKFFLDRSVVRRIEEKDGATIYFDGRQGLRTFPHGSMEYTCLLEPQEGGLLDYLTALERALEFISTHGGLPEGVHPVELPGPGRTLGLQEVTLSYSVNGIPVWGNTAPVVVRLGQQGVGFYLRDVRTVVGQSTQGLKSITAEQALDIVSRHWMVTFPEGTERAIKDISMGYWSGRQAEEPETLKPVWVVESTSGYRGFVDAVTGAVWGEERAGR